MSEGHLRQQLGVLVVEDNELIRAMETDILTSLGYGVTVATSAEEALQALADQSIGLLVTDIRLMGAVDGIALAREARRRRPSIRIMLVGAALDQLAPEDLADIAHGSLGKPFTIRDFEERLAVVLETK